METLHPTVRSVWTATALVIALIAGGFAAVADHILFRIGPWVAGVVFVLVAAAGIAYARVHYRIWKFDLQDDALVLTHGVLTRIDTAVPYVRIQHVDSQRGPIERLVGLASVVVYTAGSRGADITIPGLTPTRAESLRDRLRRLAVESEPEDAV